MFSRLLPTLPITRFVFMKPKYFRIPLITISVVFSAALASPLVAADFTWTGATDSAYNVNNNWNPNTGVPGTADNVRIATSTPNSTNIPSGNWDRRGAGTTTIDGTGVVNLNTGDARFLNNGTFNMLGGQLVTSGQYFIVGNGGVGTLTQSGGAIDTTLRRGFFLSDANGDSGSIYNLSGGTLRVKSATESGAAEESRGVWFGKGVDGAGTDQFNVTGGSATFEKTGTSVGNVLLSGKAEMNITTGTVTFDKYNETRIGYKTNTAGSQAKINVNSGTLNFTNGTGNTNVRIGYNGKGLMNISGGAVNLKGSLGVGTGGSTGTLIMTNGIFTVTNTGTDIIGGGNGGNGTVSLFGTSVLDASTTKWKTGDFGGTANTGVATISLNDTASLTLKGLTIGHIGGDSAIETVTLRDHSTLTVHDFITIGRDDNATQSGITSFLNLNGGTLATRYIQKGSDNSNDLKNNVNADGGTIQALAAEADFFKLGTRNPGRVFVNLQEGGLTFDTNGFAVGIQTGLHGTGGITKTGVGTLTLSNLDDYTGTTVARQGTLEVTTGNGAGTAMVVEDGAALAITGDPYQTWNVTNLTLGTVNGTTIDFQSVDSSTAPITVTGDLITHGTVVLKKTDGMYEVGVFPLIQFPMGASVGGSGLAAFQLPPLPRGVSANLTTTNSKVSLNVTSVNVLKWKGNVNSKWDINTTANWTLGGSADQFQQSDNLQFDDLAQRTAIALDATVSPASMTFDNSTKDYTISGTGGIAGMTGLTKKGTGMLTLATVNTYTGATTVDGGTLRLGDGTNDGSLAGPLVTNDADVIFNTAVSAQLGGSLVGYGVASQLTKTGPGTMVFTGEEITYSGVLEIQQGAFVVGDGSASVGLGTSTSYEIAAGARLGIHSATAATPTWATISGAGVVSLNSQQPVNGTAGWGDLAVPVDFTGTIRVEKGRVESRGADRLGGTSKIQILDGAQLLAFASDDPYTTDVEIAGNGWGEIGYPGSLRLASGATATWAGKVTLTADSGIQAQRGADFTITGTISGPFQSKFYVGDPAGENGTLRIAPAAAVQNSYAATLIDGRPGGAVIAGNSFAFSTGPLQVVNAVLKLNGNSFTFANLSGTGGIIGNFHEMAPAVLAVGGDNSSTAFAGAITDGGAAPLSLVKNGSGTLSLTGTNTYSGDTTVSKGTLSLSTPFLDDESTVTLASGAIIDLATGAQDMIGKLVINGVTVPAGTYSSSHPTYGAYFAGTGSLVIAGGGYSSWATANGLNETNNGLGQDPDNDGISNLLEFYLNGNPLAANTGILPVLTSDATSVTLTFSRRGDAAAAAATQAVQYGSDLSGWTDVVLGAANAGPDANGVTVTIVENGEADTISVRIPRANAVGAKLFARLKVSM